jgi:tetrahydromethanopterin S-methyltransferase subunit E
VNQEVQKRYFKEFGVSMGFYVVLLIASISVLTKFELPKAAQIVITLIPVIPTIFVVVAVMRALRDSDELQQKIQLQAVTFSAVVTGLITFTYGFLENIGFSHLPSLFIFPLMLALWGIGVGIFARNYR